MLVRSQEDGVLPHQVPQSTQRAELTPLQRSTTITSYLARLFENMRSKGPNTGEMVPSTWVLM
jgi:hypothetical protein